MPSEEKLLENLGALTNMVRRIAVDAGEVVLRYYELDDKSHIEEKADGSPVSLADREAETFIAMSLTNLTPTIPVFGEEAAELGRLPDMGGSGYFWLVDPLDGTKEFITGGTDFTVNIALIHDKKPCLGVVYAPASGILYAGHGPGSAIRWSQDSDTEKAISVRSLPPEGLVVVASRSHGDRERLDSFLEKFKVQKLIQRGSSLKICTIAEAKADLYPRFGPTCEWDTAAGHAVLNAAGGMITDTQGRPLQYGGANPKFLNPEFIASSFEWWAE